MSQQVVMCAPSYLPALANERSWVADSSPLDRDLALDQWHRLRYLVEAHIGPVVELPAEPWAPAMTFTRDLALSTDEAVVPLMPTSHRGPFEAPLVQRCLTLLGTELTLPAEPLRFDGGNVLADSHGRLLVGVFSAEPASEVVEAVRFMEAATGRVGYRVPLAGGRFPHIDMAIADLDGTGWLVYPDVLPGFDLADPDWNELFLGLPVIEVDPADGEQLACNIVINGDIAIGPEISTDLAAKLDRHGLTYHGTDLGELLKAGGGAHCSTLELTT